MITNDAQRVYPPDTAYYCDEWPTLEDVAMSQGRLVRFAGHPPAYYTVLCHTLVGVELVPQQFRREFLLHDGTEVVVNDTPTTWKTEEMRRREAALLGGISLKHGLGWPWQDGAEDAVKRVDLACMIAEAWETGLATKSDKHEAYWGAFPQDDLVLEARERTRLSMYVGNPIRFIEPRNSIPAFLRAWKASS